MKRPLVYPAASLCFGILFSHLLKFPITYLFVANLAFLILAIFHLKNKTLSHVNLYIAVFFLGALFYRNSNILPVNHISKLVSEDETKIFLRGVIIDDPIISETFYNTDRISFVLNANSVKEDSAWKKTTGLVRVDVYKNRRNFNFGDEVILEGLISRVHGLRNPGIFDYSRYMAVKNIYSALKVKENNFVETVGINSSNPVKKSAYSLRHKIRSLLDAYFDEPFNGFLKAILIGDRSDLKYSLKDDFVKTGTVHILAISGLHVGLIASIFLFVFAFLKVPKKANLILTMVLLVFYSFAAGSNPPILRAVIIFFVFVAGYLINRETDILNSLSIAAILILLWNPKELFDPSFQLSFASVASIVVFAPKIDSVFKIGAVKGSFSVPTRIRLYILKSVSISIAAWLGVWPFVSYYFNIASPIAIIANIIIIPFLFVVMAASLLFLFISAFSNFFTAYLAKAISIIQEALFFINHSLSILPFSYFRTAAPSIIFSALYYSLLSLFVFTIRKKYIFIAILLFLNVVIWKDTVVGYKGKFLKITFFDVGQGDSILIEFPKKGNILIDGGSGGEEEKFDIGRSVIAPYLWNSSIKRLDAIIVTHFHEDHLGGILYLLKNFDVGCVMDNGAKSSSDDKLYGEYKKVIREKRIRHIAIGEGDEIGPIDHIRLYVLNPEKKDEISDSNDNSIVLKLVYENKKILFCGDITDKTMECLSSSYGEFLKSDILKIPHHGSFVGKEGTVKNFLKRISPEVSIISVGRRSRFKAQLEKVINIITSLNSDSYNTRDNGAIRIFIGPNSFKVAPFTG